MRATVVWNVDAYDEAGDNVGWGDFSSTYPIGKLGHLEYQVLFSKSPADFGLSHRDRPFFEKLVSTSGAGESVGSDMTELRSAMDDFRYTDWTLNVISAEATNDDGTSLSPDQLRPLAKDMIDDLLRE